jgi:putative DNA primase/helicase
MPTAEPPHRLRDLPRWLLWKDGPVRPNGKPAKPPFQVNGEPASVNDPATWTSHPRASLALKAFPERFRGLGFVLAGNDGLVGIDLDIEADSPTAREIIELFKGTYIEASPNRGLHVWCIGAWHHDHRRETADGGVEVYTEGRYLTWTGRHIDGTAAEPTEQPEALAWLAETYFANSTFRFETTSTERSAAGPLSDDAILELAGASRVGGEFRGLWEGEDGAFASASEADLRLCGLLAFYTDDVGQIDRLFRRSGLMRPKWDERRGQTSTYGANTIAKALRSTKAHYSGNGNGTNGAGDDKSRSKKTTSAGAEEAAGGGKSKVPDLNAMREQAKVHARWEALQRQTKTTVVADIKRRWAEIAADTESIAKDAYAWAVRYAPGAVIDVRGIPQRITSLEALNKRFAWLEVPDNPACVVLRKEARSIPRDDLNTMLANEIVITGLDKKGEVQPQPAAGVWIKNAYRHTYTSIVFTGKPVPPDTMNLWRGWGVKPKKGCCVRQKQHILEVVCADDRVAYEAMLNLIAWQMQNIGRPSRIIVLLISKKGQTGKGTLLEFILLPIFGAAGLMIQRLEDITGPFNAILKGKAYNFLDEAMFKGDRKGAAVIKSLVTTKKILANEKYAPAIAIPSAVNVWAASNEEVPAYVDEEDARYWALVVSPHRQDKAIPENATYWADLYHEIENGGLEAFLHEMLERDVSRFDPQRDCPRENAALAKMKQAGMSRAHPAFWLKACLETGVLVEVEAFAYNREKPLKTPEEPSALTPGAVGPSDRLIKGYYRWAGQLRGHNVETVGTSEFWKVMSVCGFEEQPRTKHGKRRTIPDLKVLRKAVAKLLHEEEEPAKVE